MILLTNPHQNYPAPEIGAYWGGSWEGHDNKMPCSSKSLDGLYNTQIFFPRKKPMSLEANLPNLFVSS